MTKAVNFSGKRRNRGIAVTCRSSTGRSRAQCCISRLDENPWSLTCKKRTDTYQHPARGSKQEPRWRAQYTRRLGAGSQPAGSSHFCRREKKWRTHAICGSCCLRPSAHFGVPGARYCADRHPGATCQHCEVRNADLNLPTPSQVKVPMQRSSVFSLQMPQAQAPISQRKSAMPQRRWCSLL